MKALARSFVWWPGIDLDIEERVRLCEVCTQAHHSPKAVRLLLWPWSTEPWQRIHIDYAEVKGEQFLLVVDSHSKWMEVCDEEHYCRGYHRGFESSVFSIWASCHWNWSVIMAHNLWLENSRHFQK